MKHYFHYYEHPYWVSVPEAHVKIAGGYSVVGDVLCYQHYYTPTEHMHNECVSIPRTINRLLLDTIVEYADD